ncbi:flavodoxin family protein [Actinomyces weissii]|nr:flavodoxin [Actinomyces weissii]
MSTGEKEVTEMTKAQMTALVIVESCFGGTRALAEQVAAGLQQEGAAVALEDSDEAPTSLPPGLQLLVLGAPTHNRGLSTPASRQQAVSRGGRAVQRGIREWLEAVTLPSGTPVVAFDTISGRSWFAGSAAQRVAKALSRKGAGPAAATRSFLVSPQGPASGQAQEARAWGRQLATGT